MDEQQLNVWNITEQLTKARVIKLYGQVDNKMAHEVCAILDVLENDAPGEPIKLEICSPGGSVLDGLAICDKIREISSPVIAFNTGYSASMGTAISSACDLAYVSENSYMMIHELSSGTEGKFRDMKSAVEFDEKLNKHLMGMIAKRCGKTYEEIMADTVQDRWMSAEECVKYGLVDGITPAAKKPTETIKKFKKKLEK